MNGKKMILMSMAVMLGGTFLLSGGGANLAQVAGSSSQKINSQVTGVNVAKDAAIQKILDDLVKQGAPGVVVQTVDNGVERQFSAGKANIYSGRSMQPDFHFRIASITKMFVGVVALQLVGEGKIGLDDTVEKWLPGVVKGNGYDGKKITIRYLLQHTSGIGDYVWYDGFQKGISDNRGQVHICV